MFGNFFKKSPLQEDGKADSGRVVDVASPVLAHPDRGGTRIKHVEHASPSPDKYRRTDQREDRILSLDAVDWLQSLPRDVRPSNLANRYPRICNRMAERWKYPDLMMTYFDDLLMDRRGGRQGLPLTIAIEISALKEHHQATISATKDDVWNRVVASRMF
jgi:hypothetical protein